MLNSQILEVAIGLAFIYLLFCLICSMFNEWIASALLKWRSKTLFQGIKSLLKDPRAVYDLYAHPLINALAKRPPLEDRTAPPTAQQAGQPSPASQTQQAEKEELKSTAKELDLRKQPSAIPSRTFALALLDLLAPTKGATGSQTLAHIRNAVSQQTDPKYDWVKRALLPLLDAAQDDLEKALKNVEQWFDDGMDRVTGWYKRKTQLILTVLGLLICIVMNVDTFAIANSLYNNSALRSAVVTAAEKRAQEPLQPPAPASSPTKLGEKAPPAPSVKPEKGAKQITRTAAPGVAALGTPAGAITPSTPPAQGKEQKPKAEEDTIGKNLEKAVAEVQKLNLPIGWTIKSVSGTKNAYPMQIWGYIPLDWNLKPGAQQNKWFKFFGWIFSALAISLGAPFWFDLLNKLVNLRGGGKPAEKAAEAAKT